MKQVTPAFYDLGRRLLVHEAGGDASPADPATAEAVFLKLWARLTILLGQEGFHSLLARTLHVARLAHPLLHTVELNALPRGGATTGLPVKGLRQSAAFDDPAAFAEAVAILIGTFLWLLARFIGQGTTLRELSRIWPTLTFPEVGPNIEEARL